MEDGPGETASFYRREAAECRRQADEAEDAAGRHGCLSLARHYERQARLIEMETLKEASPNVAILRRGTEA